MKYFARSALDYISNQVKPVDREQGSGGTFLYMLPSLPAEVVTQIGTELVAFCHSHCGLSNEPLIRVSLPLVKYWNDQNGGVISDSLRTISKHGWVDENDSLTSYRNAHSSGSKNRIVLLIGVDRVADSSSLSDFHHCDFATIWERQLDRRFSRWITAKLKEGAIGYDEETVQHFNWILLPIVDRGLADVLQISTLLERLDLASAQDGGDAEKLLLEGLDSVGLPSLTNFRFPTEKAFGCVLDQAIDFFSYDTFIDESKRTAAIKKIEQFVAGSKSEDEGISEEDRPTYDSNADFVAGLKNYVETGDHDDRERLLKCDFNNILNKILKYREPGDPNDGSDPKPPKTTIRKLSGGAVEVLLSALWSTLGQFKAEASNQNLFAHESLRKIEIQGIEFKHDYEGADAEDRKAKASGELTRLLGGVDEFIEKWINDSALCSNEDESLISSSLINDGVSYMPARTAEPTFRFSITIEAEGLDNAVVRQFAWRLPKIHAYRVADDLVRWAVAGLQRMSGRVLPVYQVPFYDELMLATDDEETRRVLSQCIGIDSPQVNLLSADELDPADPLLPRVQRLASAYERFLDVAGTNGIHVALANNWDELRKAYQDAADHFLNEPACETSPVAKLLFRAFLIISSRDSGTGDRWMWEEYERSCAITVLHPALLEMLRAQMEYLLTAFNSLAAKELRSPGRRAFRETAWQGFVDLAQIQMPLCGILKDSNRVLETDIRGENLIHRIGTVDESNASLTTKLMLRYDSLEDDEVADSELFGTSRESVLIQGVLEDYSKLHPHAEDGLSIAVYQNEEIQPTIAALDNFLKKVCKERSPDAKPYALSVTFFTQSSDDSNVARWIAFWKDRWEQAENQPSFAHYQSTRLSVAHRIVSPTKHFEQFISIINDGLEVDIAVLMNFIGAGRQGNKFQAMVPYDQTSRRLKFPILEKSACALRDPGQTHLRARILSNRQFLITSAHSEIVARLQHEGTRQGTEHVVLGYGDYTPWQGVVDALHRRCEWVVCIDPNIDEKLIAQRNRSGNTADELEREIIGFGSGVGAHGEANYTVSTEHFQLSDVLYKLVASIEELYADWDAETYQMVAQSVLQESQKLSGLSLVNATGVGQYIRDFMAYSLSRKLLRADEGVLCDQIVSLDAYRHWFDSAESGKRPDLLWLVARILDDGRLSLDLRLIECKLAQMSETHLEKAREQLENGLRHLPSVFMPRSEHRNDEDSRPDLRYWWLQLHRLIASKATIRKSDEQRVLTALERLADGEFEISWQASALTFWTDQGSSILKSVEVWPWAIDGQEIGIDAVACGHEFVRLLCEGKVETVLPWSGGSVAFNAKGVTTQKPDADDTKDDEEHGRNEEDDNDGGLENEVTPDPPRSPGTAKRSIATDGADAAEKQSIEPIAVKIPERILLGESLPGSRKVYWEFGHPKLSNRHILIFGSSGQGKTYTIECLLSELGRASQNSLIIDYTSGFMDHQLEPEFKDCLQPKQHIVRQHPLRINPFREQNTIIGDAQFPEGASATAQRVSGVFAEVYHLGDQQYSAMYQAIKQGVEQSGGKGMSLKDLIPRLDEIVQQKGANAGSAGSVISKLQPFLDQNPFGTEEPGSWERLFNDPVHRCHIVQLAGFMGDASRLVTEFSLIDLFWFFRVSGTQQKPRVIVLDEVQNLDHREESPLSHFLREGRKFGFSLILATQIMSNMDKDERDRLFLAGHKLFFKPADTELKSYAEIACMIAGGKADQWQTKLASLKQGECYSLGPSLNEAKGELETKAFKIRIASLQERG